MQNSDIEGEFAQSIRNEVSRQHDAIETWAHDVSQEAQKSFARLENSLGDNFHIVKADGSVSGKAEFLDHLKKAAGSFSNEADRFKFRIDNFRAKRAAPDAVIVTYEIWRDFTDKSDARLMSAVLAVNEADPENFTWLHAQETWRSDNEGTLLSQ